MITSIKGTYLSNFYECTVTYEGRTYRNAEAAYQASKFTDALVKDKFVNLLASTAKALGRSSWPMRERWAELRLGVMEEIVSAKFHQNPELAELLISTGDEEIIEGNTWGDTYWGVCRGVGYNNLGKILMRVRSSLK